MVYSLDRTTVGQILSDNFDDNVLTGWSSETAGGGAVAEANQQIEETGNCSAAWWTARASVRQLVGTSNVVLEADLKLTEAAGTGVLSVLSLWSSNSQAFVLSLFYENTTHDFEVYRNTNVTLARDGKDGSGWTQTVKDKATLEAYDTYKIVYNASTKVATAYYWSGAAWTAIGNRTMTWTTDLYAWLGGYARTNGDTILAFQDNFKAYSSETITMTNMVDEQYFEIIDSADNILGTSADANLLSATLDLSTLEDRPPYHAIRVYDHDDTLLLTDATYEDDVWGGDTYNFLGQTILTGHGADRNVSANIEQTAYWPMRNIKVKVVTGGNEDRNMSLNVELLHSWLNRNMSLTVEDVTIHLDRNICLSVAKTIPGGLETYVMLGGYEFPNWQTIDLDFERSVARRTIASKDIGYKHDLGMRNATVTITGFILAADWETHRAELEALKDDNPKVFDWGLGPPTFMAYLYDFTFERALDPVTLLAGVRYTVKLAITNEVA